MRAGRPEEAIDAYQRSLHKDPTFTRNHLSLAAAQLEKGDKEAARPHLAHYVEAHPEHLEVRARYVELLWRTERFEEARKELEVLVAEAQEQGEHREQVVLVGQAEGRGEQEEQAEAGGLEEALGPQEGHQEAGAQEDVDDDAQDRAPGQVGAPRHQQVAEGAEGEDHVAAEDQVVVGQRVEGVEVGRVQARRERNERPREKKVREGEPVGRLGEQPSDGWHGADGSTAAAPAGYRSPPTRTVSPAE